MAIDILKVPELAGMSLLRLRGKNASSGDAMIMWRASLPPDVMLRDSFEAHRSFHTTAMPPEVNASHDTRRLVAQYIVQLCVYKELGSHLHPRVLKMTFNSRAHFRPPFGSAVIASAIASSAARSVSDGPISCHGGKSSIAFVTLPRVHPR